MSTTGEIIESFEVRIPSDTAAGQAIQDRILGLLEAQGFHDRDLFGCRLALEEAIINAIKHGNQMDADKSVRILCQIWTHKVRVEIEDQGEGFQPEEVPDPTLDENLERPCGRGIMLMKAFMTVVEYNSAGTCVVLERERTTGDDPQ